MALDFNEQGFLYNLAYECEGHFDQLLETSQKTKSEVTIIELCVEFQQRFAIWTAHLGVFAQKSQCLDTRLRNLPDLKDLVARLLDILRRSLLHCITEISNQREKGQVLTSEAECLTGTSQIQVAAFNTIDDIITRLNRLGVTIRQSNKNKIDFGANEFSKDQNVDSFAFLCKNAIETLYPGAHQSLKDYLSKSMITRVARIRLSSSRHQSHRARQDGLPTAEEIPSKEPQINVHTSLPEKTIMDSDESRLQKMPNAFPKSDVSTVDSQLRQPDDTSTKAYKASSIQVKLGNYPRLPGKDGDNNIISCPWCGEPLDRKKLTETDWRQHIDRDFKPYICLSEECPDLHPSYPTFNEWNRHMELHNWRWYQQAYSTPSWWCTFCGPNHDVYTSPKALYSHLSEIHRGNFTREQLQAISRQSKVERPRAWNECFLCCFTIDEQESKDESTVSKRQEEEQKQKTVKSSRKNLEMTSPSHHNPDLDLSDTSDSDNSDFHQQTRQRKDHWDVAGRHIAAHLQVLMLLALRFAALKGYDGDLDNDRKGDSADINEEKVAASEDKDPERLSPPAKMRTSSKGQQCWECLRRNSPCDGKTPICGNCSSAGMVCPGFTNNRPLKWLRTGMVSRIRKRKRKPAARDSRRRSTSSSVRAATPLPKPIARTPPPRSRIRKKTAAGSDRGSDGGTPSGASSSGCSSGDSPHFSSLECMQDTADKSKKNPSDLYGDITKDGALVFSPNLNFRLALKQLDDEAANDMNSNNVTNWLSHITLSEDANTTKDDDLAAKNGDVSKPTGLAPTARRDSKQQIEDPRSWQIREEKSLAPANSSSSKEAELKDEATQSPPSGKGQVFASRYDFAVSLAAAKDAARRDREAFYMAKYARDSPNSIDFGPTPSAPSASAPSQFTAGPTVASRSYEELVNKYRHFGSKKLAAAATNVPTKIKEKDNVRPGLMSAVEFLAGRSDESPNEPAEAEENPPPLPERSKRGTAY